MAFDEVTSTPRWAPESHYAKEMAKWNRPKRDGGMNANGYEPFPKMVYKASKRPSGGPYLVVDPTDEQFSARNRKEVGNPEELEQALREGWRLFSEAIAYAKGLDDDIAKAAAHRHYEDRNMGEQAKAEAAAAEAESYEHLAEIPAKRRGRPERDYAEAEAVMAASTDVADLQESPGLRYQSLPPARRGRPKKNAPDPA